MTSIPFPQKFVSTVSHWQATNRGPTSLYLHDKDAELPASADIVIVGGGMMGASLAYFLTRSGAAGANKKVVCLEAKDLADGASGCRMPSVGPKTYRLWHELQQPYPLGLGLSPEDAARVMQNERDNLDLVQQLVEKEGLAVDFWRGDLLETHHSQEQTDESRRLFGEWRKTREKLGLGPDDTSFVDDASEAEKISRIKGTTSVHVRPGGSVHPHKLATALMRLAIDSKDSDFSFHSWTPVLALPEPSAAGWTLKTSKGDISAARVILATNAYTGTFFAKDEPLHSHIQPQRGQAATITPPPTYAGAHALQHTYNTLRGHYLVTTASGQIVLGGGWAPLVKEGTLPAAWVYGETNDGPESIDPALTKGALEFMKDNFAGWGSEAYGEGLTRTWTGIMSTSKDWLPLVGEVPGKAGLSVVAGFAGHGMSRIFTTARGYADTLATGRWDAALLPPSFELTAERLERVAEQHSQFVAEHGVHARVVHGDIVYTDRTGPKTAGYHGFLGRVSNLLLGARS
ncbi:hypothetical protein VHUM_02764 [Vanrija humicola]|uniref:FAD dependent oxidoreductase domain-containing protein n=1 Tax=Vanrija humicola TaxID=5417 RepID=A0A7D8V0R0_VANHU|nr:hypothetical protein VHUM_02764 [Vanrija humicola]